MTAGSGYSVFVAPASRISCRENRMAGCSLMHPAHTANTRADLIFIHNGAPQALVGCQALGIGPLSNAKA